MWADFEQLEEGKAKNLLGCGSGKIPLLTRRNWNLSPAPGVVTNMHIVPVSIFHWF